MSIIISSVHEMRSSHDAAMTAFKNGLHETAEPWPVQSRKAARGELDVRGASACLGLVALSEYFVELAPYPIETFLD
jgi:hypothetical protein